MAVYTNLLRHLNARWIIESADDNKVYCGISIYPIDDIKDETITVTEALNKCHLFTKVYASFVEQTTEDEYDAKFLTKQIYKENIIVNKHTFLDNVCYWRFVSQQYALENKNYNTNVYFALDNTEPQYYNEFKNIMSFYFFYNLKINNEYPSSTQIIKQPSDTCTADFLIIKEQYGFFPVISRYCFE